jgi:Flp pilus assembly pilin Flp
MNPLHEPTVLYLRALLSDRVSRLRDEDTSRGASAIEWAVITGLLAFIAIGIGGLIYTAIKGAANNINTGDGTVPAK